MSQLIEVASWTGGTRASVVFVHGIGGHAYETWRRHHNVALEADSTFWPVWLAEDVEGLTAYTLSYEAPVSNWLGAAMPLQDRVVNMLECLLNAQELSKYPIIFICHSLGGLLVKQIMLDLKEQESRRPEAARFLSQIKGVVFLATPHTGSRVATLLDRMSLLFWPSSVARGLIANDPALRRLNVPYRRLADDRRGLLEHRIYYETLNTSGATIVDEASGDPGLHSDPVPIQRCALSDTLKRRLVSWCLTPKADIRIR